MACDSLSLASNAGKHIRLGYSGRTGVVVGRGPTVGTTAGAGGTTENADGPTKPSPVFPAGSVVEGGEASAGQSNAPGCASATRGAGHASAGLS